MSATPTHPRCRAPMLGEHTEEVLISLPHALERVVDHVLRNGLPEHRAVVARRAEVNVEACSQ